MAVSLAVPRGVSASSPVASPGRLPNLPVIEHPMSRLGDRADLAVRGSSTTGLREAAGPALGGRSKTEMSIRPTGKSEVRGSSTERILNWPPAVDKASPFEYTTKPVVRPVSFPDIKATGDTSYIPANVDKFPRVGAVPKLPPLPSIGEQEEYLKGPGKPHVKSKEYNYQPKTTAELIELIREKFGTGYYGIRHLFRSNDPTAKGQVSREALQRILYTLCGYITPNQYTQLLRTMHLDGKAPIHFDTFVQYFKETEDKKNWVAAIQAQSMHQPDPNYPETYLRRGDMRVHDPYTSMPFSDAIFKEKCKSKNFDAHKVFPASVFEPNGLILAPQLREAYATLGIYMSDEDFNKLWQRYDKEGTNALHTDNFFRLCGLDPQGRPRQAAPYTPRGAAYAKHRPHSEIGHTNGLETSREAKKILKKEGVQNSDIGNLTNRTVDQQKDVTTNKEKIVQEQSSEKPQERKIEIKKPPKVAPKLDNIIDCLHYKFEEPYQAMLNAFQLFDFLNDSYVSKIDFRRVLQEFGLDVSPSELETFLKKNSLKVIKGQLNYREFLNKFQTKSENSITSKIAKDDGHAFHGSLPNGGSALSADQLEGALIEHLHGDFIKLLIHFRKADKYGLGVVTAYEVRSGIERRLGYAMTEPQWEQLKLDVGQDKDGLIPYTKFLEIFDISPGSWNFRQEGTIRVAQVIQEDIPTVPTVERLQERAKTEMVPPVDPPKPTTNLKSLEEFRRQKHVRQIKGRIDELFKTKFHSFDKNFKAMDRRQTGRMSKWQFGALLKMTGLTLHNHELDQLWSTLNLATDGMYSYSTLIQHFVNFKVPHEEKEAVVYENMFNVDEAEEIWYDAQEDNKELVEAARRIQRERRMEQMKKDHEARTLAREHNEEWVPELAKKPATTASPRVAPSAVSRASSVASIPASHASFSSVHSVRTKTILVKIRTDVVDNWDGLKSVFKYIDRTGSASIPISEMKEIMNSMHFSLDEDEKTELCKRFDSMRNGRFNYLQFMKCFAQRKPKENASMQKFLSKYTHTLQTQKRFLSVKQFCRQEQIIRQQRVLLRAFQKLDRGRKGYVSIQEFRRTLCLCNITFGSEDLYNILTEFDHNMDGRIHYDAFLRCITRK